MDHIEANYSQPKKECHGLAFVVDITVHFSSIILDAQCITADVEKILCNKLDSTICTATKEDSKTKDTWLKYT